MKGPSLYYEPIRSETFQMELGNREDPVPVDERQTVANQRIRSSSRHSTPVRVETARTVPTDISLMYRYVCVHREREMQNDDSIL